MKYIFEDKLGISPHKLEGGAVEWDEIVQRIENLQRSGEYRVAIHGQDVDALVIAQRIMRKENFMIYFFNRDILDLSFPPEIFGNLMKGPFFSKSLEWSIYFCVLNYMFNHKYQIRPAFYLDSLSLKRRFFLCGIAHAVFMPFLLFFMTLHFLMLNVYDWRSTKKYLGPLEWSLCSRWAMREFNELPHQFEKRLGHSYEPAERYLKIITKSPAVAALGKLISFVSGSLGAVLLFLAALNDAILLHVKIGDWNLLWYVGIFGVIFAVGNGLLPNAEVHPRYSLNLFAEMDGLLGQVATHTHFYPDHWKKRAFDAQTQKEFSAMIQYKAQLFISEVLSVIVAPIILCISLPKCADKICKFVEKVRLEVPGAGDVCGFSCFDFDSFGDENWEGRKLGNEGGQNNTVRQQAQSRPKTTQGKMEKSFFSFKAAHPTWKPSLSGQNLVERVENYRKQQTLAFAREQEHHAQAAARQLETLRRLEKEGTPEEKINIAAMNDTYITEKVAGLEADNGGGRPIQHPLTTTIDHDPPTSIPMELSPGSLTSSPLGGDTPPFLPSGLASAPFASSSFRGAPNAPSAFLTSRVGASRSLSQAASIPQLTDDALSMELRRLLNRSSMVQDLSIGASSFANMGPSFSLGGPGNGTLASIAPEEGSDPVADAGRQYLWLERYHLHLADQRRRFGPQEQGGTYSVAGFPVDRMNVGTIHEEEPPGDHRPSP